MGDGVKSTSDRLHCYAYSTIKAPDKGEVGGSSPPRPTIFCANVSLFLLKIQCLRGRAKSRPGDALFSNLKAVGSIVSFSRRDTSTPVPMVRTIHAVADNFDPSVRRTLPGCCLSGGRLERKILRPNRSKYAATAA